MVTLREGPWRKNRRGGRAGGSSRLEIEGKRISRKRRIVRYETENGGRKRPPAKIKGKKVSVSPQNNKDILADAGG